MKPCWSFVTMLLMLPLWTGCDQKTAQDNMNIDIHELTIHDIHEHYRQGTLSVQELTQAYIRRIEAFDQSTTLNAIVEINPHALDEAIALDEEFRRTGNLRPLHGIPVIVKDNYHTAGIRTTGGSRLLKNFIPPEDATHVRKLKEAGALVLAKSNMAEWAFSPMHTESSHGGVTRNPYNLNHVPAGSSGGTAAAVSANFGMVGLGTDTGNSIRGPSSHTALVGIRPSLGLTSRSGIIPLFLRNDTGGPMCRTVLDAALVLEAIDGYDPDDPLTVHGRAYENRKYTDNLHANDLDGARIGVLIHLTKDMDEGIRKLFNQALEAMENQGAQVIRDFGVDGFDELRQDQWCADFRKDIEQYLTTYQPTMELSSLDDIIAAGPFSEFTDGRLKRMSENSDRWVDKSVPCGDPFTDPKRRAFRDAIEAAMDNDSIDILVYPSWNYPPARIDHFEKEYRGDNSQIVAPHTGQPAMTVPMGFLPSGLPTGIQFLGRIFDEQRMIRIAYAFERATQHRKPPYDFTAGNVQE
jgi:Asp-tRNA(Asn)/Glu-tRNA(Gln) amidotransferase A subunit family amidase